MVNERLSDPIAIKQHFPVFSEHPELIYLDNAATTHRPQVVIDRLVEFHRKENASIRRGAYHLAAQATQAFDSARATVAGFFHAPQSDCIAFTSGTTESVNMVARSMIGENLQVGDNVVVSLLEHHANFVPWQVLCQTKGAELRIAPVDESGNLLLEELEALVDKRTALVAVVHISNTVGTINPIEDIIQRAHQKNVPVLIDAAQSAALYPLDVSSLDCDFLVASGHKMFGPLGVGILYVHPRWHQQVNPYNYGGGIVQSVTVENTEYLPYPYVLEAGTPNVSGVVGLAEAIRFIQTLDRSEIQRRLDELTKYARQRITETGGLSLVGCPERSSSIVSFRMKGMHPHDVSSFLNEDGIAVRAGQHCTQPLLDRLGVSATVRISLSVYNSKQDVDRLCNSMQEMKSWWV